MQKSDPELLKQIHEAYTYCKEVFEPRRLLIEESFNLEDEEEVEFFGVVSSFFLQKKQESLINQ
ncbi:MAG: hypothetical protein LUE29_02320 [Lachnospiraceae bacterium]|nr:hypothetical protein [Lachnospiraceae bacterium]